MGRFLLHCELDTKCVIQIIIRVILCSHTMYACMQEHYLPHIMHSKLKLACSGLDDPNFSDFLNKALQDAKQRALLESEYCTELALYSILKDDLDRARYYTGLCLQSFLQVAIRYAL